MPQEQLQKLTTEVNQLLKALERQCENFIKKQPASTVSTARGANSLFNQSSSELTAVNKHQNYQEIYFNIKGADAILTGLRETLENVTDSALNTTSVAT